MCGIVGAVSRVDVAPFLLKGLQRLEYRGYDSAGMVVINDDTCIGCGTCANSCPYENISLVQISDQKGTPVVDEATHRPIMKATKCDLCSDQLGGPACVRACPHDALRRMDFREFAS